MKGRRREVVRIFTNVVVALPLVLALAFLAWMQLYPDDLRDAAGNASISLRVGEEVPPIDLEDAGGRTVALRELVGTRGAAIVLVNPDCEHCHAEMVALTRLTRARGRPDLPVVIVSVGDAERISRLRQAFPLLPFYHDTNDALPALYGLNAVPVLLVADGTGHLRQVRGGAQGEAYLREVFRTLGAG